MYGDIVLLTEAHKTKEQFFHKIRELYPEGSPGYKLIRKAYHIVENALRGTLREDGRPAMSHPHAVALIVHGELKRRIMVSAEAIAAALLHDLTEEFPCEWPLDRIRHIFGVAVASLLKPLIKEPVAGYSGDREARDSDYHERLWCASFPSQLIKLADRLHNHMTLWGLPEKKVYRKLKETENFYLLLARRSGVLKEELEWICDHIPSAALHACEPAF